MAFVQPSACPPDPRFPVASDPGAPSRPLVAEVRAAAAGLVSALVGWLWLKGWPAVELGWFAGGSARLAGLFTGAPVRRVAMGWMLPVTGQPIMVTAACSATDYFLILSALLGWQLARQGKCPGLAWLIAPFAALPLTVFLNALRVVAVTHAHRWLIPLLPRSYGPFLHLLTGVAIFLPALVTLNLLLELYGTPRPAVRV